MACKDEIEPYLRWCLPLSLCIWRVTGIRSAMASMPSVGDVRKAPVVMNIEWDYNYYQPWSDNEWLVDEILVMLDKDITMQ